MLAGLTVLALVPGTGGFGAVATERSVDVAVVDDDRALLGVETTRLDRCGDRQRALVIENRLGTDLHTVEAEVLLGESDVRATVTSTPGELSVGEAGEVQVRVTPDAPPDDGLSGATELRPAVVGDDIVVELSRTVGVDCPGPARNHGTTTTS
jgi:hypothetical protein